MFYLIPFEFREFLDFIEKSSSAWITHLWVPSFLESGRERVLREKCKMWCVSRQNLRSTVDRLRYQKKPVLLHHHLMWCWATQSWPSQKGSDKVAFVGIWHLAMINPLHFPAFWYTLRLLTCSLMSNNQIKTKWLTTGIKLSCTDI